MTCIGGCTWIRLIMFYLKYMKFKFQCNHLSGIDWCIQWIFFFAYDSEFFCHLLWQFRINTCVFACFWNASFLYCLELGGKGLWISFHHVNSLYIGSRCLKDNVLPFTILGGIYYIKICIFFHIAFTSS